jgi:hypothetical protein
MSKYVSLRTADSIGVPTARSRRWTARSHSGWFGLIAGYDRIVALI